jgi:hypothetical protein
MKDVMKIRIAVSALFLTMGSISHGQAVPSGGPSLSSLGAGPNFPTLDGVLHYSLSASEAIQLGYYGPGEVTHSTVLSGNVSYTAKSEVRPFSLLLSSGVILANQQGQGTSGYVNIAASQGYVTRSWVFNISDSFSFLPQSPTTGLSGIPGVGDLGAAPVQGPVAGPAGGILSNAGDRYGNTLGGSVERQLSRNMSVSGTGSWSTLHFLDNNGSASAGLDYSQVSGVVSLNRHFSGRTSGSLDAVYSTYSYTGVTTEASPPDIESRGLNVSIQHLLSRNLSVSASVGPQWVSSSNGTLIPSRLSVAATGSISYQRGFTTAAVAYSRGVSGGSGVVPGANSDIVSGSLAHTYGRNWVASLNVGYSHTAGLTQQLTNGSLVPRNLTYDTVYGGAQLTRRINEHFSGYVSYFAQNQTNNFSLTQNAFNGTSQTFGVGITFTPRSTRLGQF